MSTRGHFTKTNISPGGGKGTGGSYPFPSIAPIQLMALPADEVSGYVVAENVVFIF